MASSENNKPVKGKRRRFGTIIIVLGLLLVCGAIGLTFYNLIDDNRAAREASSVLDELEGVIPENITPALPTNAGLILTTDGTVEEQDLSMPVKEINGYDYIGELYIPSLEIVLPVMAEWDYTRLKVSPCVFTGNYKTNDLVICAHNYSSHFGKLLRIEIGAEVYLTTVDGVVYHYEVTEAETVDPMNVEQMIENSHNSDSDREWDLTLFTCDLGGQTRHTVRCIQTDIPSAAAPSETAD